MKYNVGTHCREVSFWLFCWFDVNISNQITQAHTYPFSVKYPIDMGILDYYILTSQSMGMLLDLSLSLSLSLSLFPFCFLSLFPFSPQEYIAGYLYSHRWQSSLSVFLVELDGLFFLSKYCVIHCVPCFLLLKILLIVLLIIYINILLMYFPLKHSTGCI